MAYHRGVVYRFGNCTLDSERLELRRDGILVPVEPQVFGVLQYLLEHRGQVTPKEDILAAVWGHQFVTEATLSSRIMAARRAIGDSGSRQEWIKTFHGRGFRFVGVVENEHRDVGALLDEAQAALDRADADQAGAILERVQGLIEESGGRDRERAIAHQMRAQCLLLKEGWRSEDASRHYEEAIRLAEGVGAVEVFRSARFHLATMLEVQGEFERSEVLMAAATSEAVPPDAAPEARELLACSLFHQGRFEECLLHSAAAIESEQTACSRRLCMFYGESPAVSCLYWKALCQWFLGQEDAAVASAGQALRMSEQPGQIFCLAHSRQQMALFQHLRRNEALCEHWASAAQAIGLRQGLRYRAAYATILLEWARAMLRRPGFSAGRMTDALEEVEKAGAGMELPFLGAVAAEALLETGDAGQAAERIDGALARSHRSYFHKAEMLRLKARVLLAAGKTDAACEALAEALQVAKAQGAVPLQRRCDELLTSI